MHIIIFTCSYDSHPHASPPPHTHTLTQLNPNGLLSFGTRIDAIGGTFLPTTFLAGGAKLAAPFWTDHDVRIAGRILYRFTDDVSLLTRVGASISAAFDTSFSPLSLFVATWDGVPRFAGTANEVWNKQGVGIHTRVTTAVCTHLAHMWLFILRSNV